MTGRVFFARPRADLGVARWCRWRGCWRCGRHQTSGKSCSALWSHSSGAIERNHGACASSRIGAVSARVTRRRWPRSR